MKLNHMSILKRAWRILWSYRVLWAFGIVLALTTGGSGGSGANGASWRPDDGFNYEMEAPDDIQRELGEAGRLLGEFFEDVFSGDRVPAGAIALGVGLACVGLFLVVASVIARYVAENALIRLVDDYEETGDHRTVREGIKLGWSRPAFRQWLITLVIALPIAVAAIAAFALALLPLLAWTSDSIGIGAFGTVAAIGLFFLVLLATIAVATVASVIKRLAFRVASLEGLGVFASIRRGWRVFTGNLADVGLLWLIMLGLGLAFAVLLIPIVLIMLIAAGLAGGLLLLVVSGIAGLLVSGATRWIVGGIVGGAVFFALLVIPLTFISGLFEVYKSSVWTLGYRELAAIEVVSESPVPELAETAHVAVTGEEDSEGEEGSPEPD